MPWFFSAHHGYVLTAHSHMKSLSDTNPPELMPSFNPLSLDAPPPTSMFSISPMPLHHAHNFLLGLSIKRVVKNPNPARLHSLAAARNFLCVFFFSFLIFRDLKTELLFVSVSPLHTNLISVMAVDNVHVGVCLHLHRSNSALCPQGEMKVQ